MSLLRPLVCLALLALVPACSVLGGLLGGMGAARLATTPDQEQRPAETRGYHADAVAAQLSSVQLTAADHGARVAMTLTTQEAALLAGATLSAAVAPPCAAGVGAHGITLAGQPRWDRPLGIKGTSDVTLSFGDAAELLSDPTAVVDLRLASAAGQSCLRVPLGPAAGGPGLVPSSPWSLGVSARTTFVPGHEQYQSLGGGLRAARWFSRGLIGLEAGIAWVDCARPCAILPEYQLPLWLLAGAVPLQVRGFGLGLELAYGLIPGIPRQDSDPSSLTHGPRLTLQLLEVTPRIGAATRAIASSRGVELSLSYQWTWLGPAPPTLLFGLGLVTF